MVNSEPLPAVDDRYRSAPSPLMLAVAAAALVVVSIWAFAAPTGRSVGEAGVRADPSQVYNPVVAGEALPDGFRQLLPRDAILPVYEPEFVRGVDSPWRGSIEVIGVEINGDARAYPVSFLNGRELVVDEVGGIPILVSW